VAVHCGPHISAKTPEAVACLWEEAMEKVKQGKAKIFQWEDIKESPLLKLKISPLTTVPHKSRLF